MSNLLDPLPELPKMPVGKLNWRALLENKCPKCDWGLKSAVSLKQLEDISLKALAQHCPLCGIICENLYCKDCKFKYEEGKLYFSIPSHQQ